MRIYISLLLPFLFLTISNSVLAKENLISIDASNFYLAGVKLGMSANEAIAGLQKELKISKDKINFDSISKASGKPPRSLQVYLGKDTYSIFFGKNIYNKKSPTIVTTVELTSSQNPKDLKNNVIAKYGKPSGDSMMPNTDAVWCEKPGVDSYYTCALYQGAKLSLLGRVLRLKDDAYLKLYLKFEEEENKKNKSIL